MQRLVLFALLLSSQMPALGQIVWVSPCANKTFCLNQGSCSMGYVFLLEKAVTGCANGFINYSFKIDLYNNGSIDIQSSADTVVGDFPVGTHQVIWRAADNCGAISTACNYLFTIKDCNPPNLLCRNGLTQNLEVPDCVADFKVGDFILNVSDNCTPKGKIKLGMRLSGTGTGFPTDTTISFDHCQQGFHTLEIWAKDENNLPNQCNSYVLVQDNASACPCDKDANLDLKGCARSAGNAKLGGYTVETVLEAMPLQDTPYTKTLLKTLSDSCFSFTYTALPLNGNYKGNIRARRQGDFLNGVSTFDLVRINRHVLAQQPLDNFYQVLAADVNQSKSLTTLDIVEIRKLILGIYDTFPNAPSWRFIRPVPDPMNLLSYDIVRDTYQFSVPNLQTDQVLGGFDFIGVKIGDANANASLAPGLEDRTGLLPLRLLADDRVLQAGEAFWVTFYPAEAVELDGWQLALQSDPNLLEIKDVRGVPAQWVSLSASGELRISWLGDQPERYGPEASLFSVLVSARAATRLSGVLFLSEAALAPEAYPRGEALARSFELQVGNNSGFQTRFSAPQPNPFRHETRFQCSLENAGSVVLELFDLTGRRCFRTETALDAGVHSLSLPASALPGAGLWVYRISDGTHTRSGRVVMEL